MTLTKLLTSQMENNQKYWKQTWRVEGRSKLKNEYIFELSTIKNMRSFVSLCFYDFSKFWLKFEGVLTAPRTSIFRVDNLIWKLQYEKFCSWDFLQIFKW